MQMRSELGVIDNQLHLGGSHMVRKSILAVLSGMILAVVLSLSPAANASCFGFCAQQIGKYYYAGCDIVMTTVEIKVTCYYIEGADPAGDPSITD